MAQDNSAIEERLRTVYANADLSDFASLLADDVRWGDDTHPNRCRSRDDVLRTFATWMDAGVTAELVRTESGPGGVLCFLHVNWADRADRARGVDFIHAFLVRDGLVSEIRRYDAAKSAREAIQ